MEKKDLKLLLEAASSISDKSFTNINSLDGRLNSMLSEDGVKNHLKDKLKEYIIIEEDRNWSDISFIGPYSEKKFYINIKITKGGNDNATSKKGLVYSLTDIEADNIPSTLNYKKIYDLVLESTNNDPFKDYYYLVFDKKNVQNVLLRGLKEINSLVSNADNDIQINWKKEFFLPPLKTSPEITKIRILNIIKDICLKQLKRFPQNWIQEYLEETSLNQ